MKKGISLPIEMIVIIAIAVLVLVVVAAFFIPGFNPQPITDSVAFASGCNILKVNYNCVHDTNDITIPGYKPSGTTEQNLQFVCGRLGYGTPELCTRACGCIV